MARWMRAGRIRWMANFSSCRHFKRICWTMTANDRDRRHLWRRFDAPLERGEGAPIAARMARNKNEEMEHANDDHRITIIK